MFVFIPPLEARPTTDDNMIRMKSRPTRYGISIQNLYSDIFRDRIVLHMTELEKRQ